MTGSRSQKGFTLIELLVVMSIIGLLLTIAVPRYFHTVERARETILVHDLSALRECIDKFYGDRGEYPDTLTALVEKHYLRTVPIDPITKSVDTWVGVQSEDPDHPGLWDVHSGSTAIAMNGTPFAEW